MEQFKLNDFTYKLTDEPQIVVEHPHKLPTSLYKFYSSSDFSIDAFTKQYIYATAPIEFNDILDSHWLLFDFSNITPNEYHKFYAKYGDNFSPKGYEQDKENGFETIKLHWYLVYSSKVGLVSMTSSPANPLMWAHYTQETGFAVEYDTKLLMNCMLKNNKEITECHYAPIQYVSKLKPIDFFSGKFKTPTIPMTCITNVKLNNWDYEKEWRLSIRKNDMGITTGKAARNPTKKGNLEKRKNYYSQECIKAVYLSAYFFGNTYFRKSKTDTLIARKRYVPFLNHIIEHHNQHLFSCGADYTAQNEVKRCYQQIRLLRKGINMFLIDYISDIHYFEE